MAKHTHAHAAGRTTTARGTPTAGQTGRRTQALLRQWLQRRPVRLHTRFSRVLAFVTVMVYASAYVALTIAAFVTQSFFLFPFLLFMSVQIAYMFRVCVNFIFLSADETSPFTE